MDNEADVGSGDDTYGGGGSYCKLMLDAAATAVAVLT